MAKNENVLCVIPARGGSKSIPDKNLQPLAGIPLFVHSIIHAIDANIPKDRIVVSSDHDSILQIAAEHDVIAHRRPLEISGDTATTESALLNALHHYPADHVLLLQPTSPLRFKNRVEGCLDTYFSREFDSLITTTKFYHFFWYEEQLTDGAGNHFWRWSSTYSPESRPRRQDLDRRDMMYFDNGNVYITDANILRQTACRVGKKVCIYSISELEGMQIDAPRDLEIFEAVFAGKIGDL